MTEGGFPPFRSGAFYDRKTPGVEQMFERIVDVFALFRGVSGLDVDGKRGFRYPGRRKAERSRF